MWIPLVSTTTGDGLYDGADSEAATNSYQDRLDPSTGDGWYFLVGGQNG